MEFAKEEVEAASGGELEGGGMAGAQAGGAPPDDAKAQALDALQAWPSSKPVAQLDYLVKSLCPGRVLSGYLPAVHVFA